MIKSILDTDLYKLTMSQAVCMLYPNEYVHYGFFNRGGTEFPEGFVEEFRKRVDAFADLKLTKDEKDFLREKCYYLNPVYIDFLNGYRFDPTEIKIPNNDKDFVFGIEGPWYRTILWETPLMAMISELYFEMTGQKPTRDVTGVNIRKCVDFDAFGIKFADFGTRRRYSFDNHDEMIVDFCCNSKSMVGTSNVYFAMINNINPIGTMAHEFIMFHAAKYGFTIANIMALRNWVNVYQGDLGIALPDTFTTGVFLKSFNTKYAKLFDGVRQDSGDPFEFTNMIVDHYKKLRIDPMTKTIVFSDGINSVELMEKIKCFCEGRIKCSFGVGTWMTNDVGVKPLNMVIKMTGVKIDGTWIPTVKLSDSKTKHTGNSEMIKICKKTLNI